MYHDQLNVLQVLVFFVLILSILINVILMYILINKIFLFSSNLLKIIFDRRLMFKYYTLLRVCVFLSSIINVIIYI